MKVSNSVLITLIVLISASAYGQVAVTGVSYFTPLNTENQSVRSSEKKMRTQLTGILMTDDPSHSLYLSSIRCNGIYLNNSEGESEYDCHVCDVTDKDGDSLIYYADPGPDNTTDIKIMGGSGKYKSMKGSGTASTIGVTEDGKFATKFQIKTE